jgi:hypothetical protein
MHLLFWRKMVSVVKYFRRNHFQKKIIFSKTFSSVWFARKNYEKWKYNCRRNPATSSHRCRIPLELLRNRSDLAGSRPFWPDQAESRPLWPNPWSGRIPDILARPGRILTFGPNPSRSVAGFGHIRPDPIRSSRLLTMAGFWSGDGDRVCRISGADSIPMTGFRRRHYSGGRMLPDSNDRLLPDSGNWISNLLVKTKSIISKNDLRFLKL